MKSTERKLIDAGALIEHLERCIKQSKGLMRSTCVAIKCFVDQMPAEDAAEVVHGRWIHGHDLLYCLLCGCEIETRDDFKYCPNCGAKMD